MTLASASARHLCQICQAVPLKYAIDAENCIYFVKKGKCKACEKFCPAHAVDFEDQKKQLTINVGAIVMAAGGEVFDPATRDVYGYTRFPNVITSLEFERILAATGPYSGHLVRPSDEKEPKKIAWLQCVDPGMSTQGKALLLGSVLHLCHKRGHCRQRAQ